MLAYAKMDIWQDSTARLLQDVLLQILYPRSTTAKYVICLKNLSKKMGIAYAKLTMRKLAQFVRIYVVMVGLYNWHVTMGILLMEMDALLLVLKN